MFYWKRNGKIGKGICPACKQKRLVRYTHLVTGEIAEDIYGVCDRVFACGYINRPPEKPIPKDPIIIPPPPPIDYTPFDVVKKSIKNPTNNLFKYCADKFGLLRTRQVFKEYLTGDSIKKPGATTFWFQDTEGNVRGGMICQYDEKGHRSKWGNIWEHSKTYNFVLCNFGDHLTVKYPDREIRVVEAPKTAILASLKYPEPLWIATNGLMALQEGRCESFRGRDVVLYPDREPDEFPDGSKFLKDYWKKKGDILSKITKSLTIFEGLTLEPEGTDIADMI